MNSPRNIASLTEKERDLALKRWYIIRPFFEDSASLTSVASAAQISRRTVRRWINRYQSSGLAGLARERRIDQGKRQIEPRLQKLIEGLALQRPTPTASIICRQITPVATEYGWNIPSYRTVADIIAHIDPALVILAHEGTHAYKDVFDLLYRHEAPYPNALWQADHALLDIWVIDEQKRAIRPWLTVILDDYSRAVAGYMVSVQAPSALNTALALHQAVWRKSEVNWQICGIPEQFYTDHGCDFTSKHIEQVCADLHINLIFSDYGVPRGRGKIERFFETVNQLCLQKLPGYTPPGSTPATAKITISEFEAILRAFILEDYHERIHSETNMKPMMRWNSPGIAPRLPESLEQLDLLLLTVAKSRRVQQDGIRFQGFRYFDTMLAAYVREDVTIRYDPRDIAEIRVYHQNTFICRAICQELASQTITLREVIQARENRKRGLQQKLSDRQAVIEQLIYHSNAIIPSQPAEEVPDTHQLKSYYNE